MLRKKERDARIQRQLSGNGKPTKTCIRRSCTNPVPWDAAHNAVFCSGDCRILHKRERNRDIKAKRREDERIKRKKEQRRIRDARRNTPQPPVEIETNVDGVRAWLLRWPYDYNPNLFSAHCWNGDWRLHYTGQSIKPDRRQKWVEDGIMPVYKLCGLDLENLS